MVLFRSAMKQVARRHGYLVSFMCRPRLPNTLRQRLASASVAARPQDRARTCSSPTTRPNCCRRSAGIISPACSRMRARRRRSPRRPSTATSAITASTRWRRSRRSGRKDNRGVMVRVLGEPGDPATHLENRVGEPLANPYLYMASQIHAGLDGIARKLEPGPSADAPYEHIGRAAAEVARRGAGCAQRQRLLPRGLRRRVRRLSTCASSRPRSRAATPRRSGQSGKYDGGHGMGAQRIFRSGVIGESRARRQPHYEWRAFRRRASSAASANNQFRNEAIFGKVEAAFGQTIQ